jgi:hypothetical protein
MKKIILAILSCTVTISAIAQTDGDYRTRDNGNWNQVSVWEVFNGGWQLLSNSAAGPFQNIVPTSASGIITLQHTVSVTANVTINQTIIENTGRLNINAGRTVVIADDFTMTPLYVAPNAVVANSGTLDLNSQLSSTSCQIDGRIWSTSVIVITNSSLLQFNSGAIYHHNHKNGGEIPLATWDNNSLCYITGQSSFILNPINNLNQAFGNFTWHTSQMVVSSFSLRGQLTTVNGYLRILDTGAGSVSLGRNANPGYTLNVGGDLRIEGGSCTLTQNQTTPSNITIGGDFIQSAGTLTMGINNQHITVFLNGDFTKTGGVFARGSGSGSGTLRFNGTTQVFQSDGSITGAVHYFVQNGTTLDLGTSSLSGTGTFTLNSGTTLNVGSIDSGGAIQLGTVAGNIRTSGTRTYQAGSTIVYNGGGAQFMGAGHPAAVNTTINNAANVTMVSNVVVNGALNVVNGYLLIESNTLTMGGTYTTAGGFSIAARTTSNITINGTGAFGDLIIAFSQFANNPINNLTINRTGGTVFLGSNLIVAGTFTQTNGNFSLGQFNQFTLTIRGPFIQTTGSFLVFNSSSLIIDGAGALPADVNIIGPNMGTLTMDRVGATFISTSALTITTLNLFNGVINNSSFNITMAANGVVTRESGGSLAQVLGVDPNSYDLIYDVATNITTGPELPFTSPVTTRLGNLTKRGVATVDLSHDIVVNGTFSIEQGTFDVGVNNDVTINRNLTVDGTFETQQGLITFGGSSDQTISGVSPIAFYDVVVNQSVASAVDLATNVDVENSLTVSSASTVNAGNQLLRLISTSTNTAYVGQSAPGAAITGTVIAERHLPNANGSRQYRYIAAPVSGTSVGDWKTELTITGTFDDPATGPDVISTAPSMFIYDETFVAGGAYRYRAYPTSGAASAAPIVLGRGYSVFGRTEGAITYDSRGTLGQGPVPVAVTNSGGTNPGWNLLGNPYAAPLDWDAVATSLPGAVDNAIYFTDNNGNVGGSGGNVSYINGVGVPASYQGIIASGQAFFVHTNGNATVTFQESHKFNGQTQFIREAPITDVLRITVKSAAASDEVALRLHEEATNGYDEKFDAFKFFNSPTLSLSMLTEKGEKLVINSVSSLSCGTAIPLTIETVTTGNHTFDFAGIETFDGAKMVRLNDKLLGKLVDLRSSSRYDFSIAEASSIVGRFEIIIGTPSTEVLNVENGIVCEPGTVLLKVKDPVALRYNWYENIGDSSPIKGATMSEFLTPSLTNSKTYYVASVSSAGCEGSRVAVKAEVMSAEPVTIAQEGAMLISNYAEGNQWYLNGTKLENETLNTLEIGTSGTYTLEVSTLGCKSVALMDVNLNEENIGSRLSVVVYPNPTVDKVNIEVESNHVGSTAKLISPLGVEIGTVGLKGENGIQRGEFDLISYPSGIYMIQIKDGNRLFIKKISKAK